MCCLLLFPFRSAPSCLHRYIELCKTFLHSWYTGLPAAQKAALRMDSNSQQLLGYRYRVVDLP